MAEDIDKIGKWLGTGSINIFGSPFSGKDTQGRKLAELFNALLIGGGDILRSHPDQETIKQLMSTGELFPTDFYFSIVLPFLSDPKLVGQPLVLSSVGRWHGEEETVMNACKQAGHPIKAVIYLNLNPEEVQHRFALSQEQKDRGKRYDDNARALDVRLEEFHNKTLPVIEFYRVAGLLIEVDGNKTPDRVTADILSGLATFARK